MINETRTPLDLSESFLKSVRAQSKSIFLLVDRVNTNPTFSSTIKKMVGESHAIEYRAEHLFMHDLKRIFGLVQEMKLQSAKSATRARFILLYNYDLTQRNDLIGQFDPQKLNALVTQQRFNENIQLIMNLTFFPEQNLDGLVMTSVLHHLMSELVPDYLQAMEQILKLMVLNSEGEISKEEQDFMNKTMEMVKKKQNLFMDSQVLAVDPNDTLELALNDLNELVGMENIKSSVNDLINFLKVKKMREESGLKTTTNSLHMVFTGPPGTGKTTVARLLGRIYKHLGYLDKGQLIETDRAGMVAGYVGQTAIKVDELIQKALDGVLFIDEAYALNPGGFNDFGDEAIEILLKRMEDYRKRLVVIVAGYPDEMNEFIQSNPGLQSRFNRYLEFEHFTPDAMMQIFKLQSSKTDFELTPDAEEKLLEILEQLYEKRHKSFGNARVVRNLFERITEMHANRVVLNPEIDHDLLVKLEEEDIPEVKKTVSEILQNVEEE